MVERAPKLSSIRKTNIRSEARGGAAITKGRFKHLGLQDKSELSVAALTYIIQIHTNTNVHTPAQAHTLHVLLVDRMTCFLFPQFNTIHPYYNSG